MQGDWGSLTLVVRAPVLVASLMKPAYEAIHNNTLLPDVVVVDIV